MSTSDDFRLTAWSPRAPAGMTLRWEFVSPLALDSLAVYVGGTVEDQDDLTGATAYVGVVGDEQADGTTVGTGRVATVEVDVPLTTANLRLVVNGAVLTVGKLLASRGGTPSPDGSITLAAGTRIYELNVLGLQGEPGGSFFIDADGHVAALVPSADDSLTLDDDGLVLLTIGD